MWETSAVGSIPAGAVEPMIFNVGVTSAVGSIPAGAGEPISTPMYRRPKSVYPRGCGGAFASAFTARLERGLSPRVRGSLVRPC